MKLYIKNMVSHCCILMVIEKLNLIGIVPKEVILGEVHLNKTLSSEQILQVKESLSDIGFELLEDKTTTLINRIKAAIREAVYKLDERPESNYSEFISQKLEHEYSYLSNIFSKETGTTIQQFIILQKIERAKDLINEDISLKEISYILHYSSVAHFCTQFKKITGMTPTLFKSMSDPFVVDKIIGPLNQDTNNSSRNNINNEDLRLPGVEGA
jgi:AraC-like DNA-binding protein